MITFTLDKIMIAGLFLILILAPSQYSLKISGAHLSPVDPLIWIIAIFWLLSILLNLKNKKELSVLVPPVPNILFLILTAFSIFKGQDLMAAAKELIQLTEYVIVAYLLYSKIVIDEKTREFLIKTYLVIISVVVLIGLIHYFGGSKETMMVKSTFGNRNVYSGFLAISLPLVLSYLLYHKNWLVKSWLVAIFTGGILTVLSGGAFIAIFISSTIICAIKSLRAFWIWWIVAAILIIIMNIMPRNNLQTLYSSIKVYDDQVKVSPRYTEWQASLQMFKENPFLGVGLGNYQAEIGTYYGYLPIPEGGKEPDHNNLYLVFISSTGLCGLFGLLILLSWWLRQGIICYFQADNESKKTIGMAAIGAVVAFSITSIWTALIVRGVFLMFAVIIAFSAAISTKK